MGSERDPDDDDVLVTRDLNELRARVFFAMGASAQACFSPSGSASRDARSRWASLALGDMVPAIEAAFRVAAAHPEEFAAHLKEPIALRKMPP